MTMNCLAYQKKFTPIIMALNRNQLNPHAWNQSIFALAIVLIVVIGLLFCLIYMMLRTQLTGKELHDCKPAIINMMII